MAFAMGSAALIGSVIGLDTEREKRRRKVMMSDRYGYMVGGWKFPPRRGLKWRIRMGDA